MIDKKIVNRYPPVEEKLNVVSHAIGLFLSIVALVFLVVRATHFGDARLVISFSIFGFSLILLYAASTLYHCIQSPVLRSRLHIIDHASIYVLIAGTYTPFTLVTLNGLTGWVLFGISWGLAISGFILKLFFTGRYNILSTVMYVLMGWMIVFAVKPLVLHLPFGGLFWLFSGGIAYTLGAILYTIDQLKFNHAVFHLLVLIGSFCHFMSVYFYVLPNG